MKRLHTAGIAALGISATGLIAQVFTDLQGCGLESKYPVAMMVGGMVLQAVTKGVHQGGTQLIDREAGLPVDALGRVSKSIPVVDPDLEIPIIPKEEP